LLDPGRRNDKRAFDESDAAEIFMYLVRLTSTRFRQERLPLILDRGYRGVDKYWPSAIMRKEGSGPAVVQYNLCVDSDRAVVECFFGVLKQTFRILGDEGFRLDARLLEPVVTICIALTNGLRRDRGLALTASPPGFIRGVPTPVPLGNLPAGATVIRARRPARHKPDLMTGLHPDTAAAIADQASRQWPSHHRVAHDDVLSEGD
jgi:hypothetical protein